MQVFVLVSFFFFLYQVLIKIDLSLFLFSASARKLYLWRSTWTASPVYPSYQKHKVLHPKVDQTQIRGKLNSKYNSSKFLQDNNKTKERVL